MHFAFYLVAWNEIAARSQRWAEDDTKKDAVELDGAYDYDLYLDEPYVRVEAIVGCNDPCPCGSGKKYNKCCLSLHETGEGLF